MSLEPDPNIEKLLAAYAKQRREKAGAPLELHPADRKRLQEEVARKFGQKRGSTGLIGTFLARFWFRIALTGGAAAILLCLVVLHEKNDQKPVVLAKNERLADVSAAPTVSKEELRADQPPKPLSKDTRSLLKDEKSSTLTVVPPPPPASPKVINVPMEASQDKLALADRDRAIVAGGSIFASSAPQGFVTNGYYVANEVLASNDGATSRLGKSQAVVPETEQLLRFQQIEKKAQFFRQNLTSPSHPKVLENFEMDRQGRKVRIIDSDGSVYSGTIAETEVLGPVTFSVSGTNISLNQSIAFSGTIYSGAEAGTKSIGAVDAVHKEKSVKSAVKPQKARISGRVQVGGAAGFAIDVKEAD